MQPGFIESGHDVFRESPHHARNGLSCASGIKVYDWDFTKYMDIEASVSQIVYEVVGDSPTPPVPIPDFPDAPQGPLGVSGLWRAFLQVYGTTGSASTYSTHPNSQLEPRGKWRIDITVTVWRKRIPADSRIKDFLFINLVTYPRSGPSNRKRLILKDDEIEEGMWNGRLVGTTGVPSENIPTLSSDPDAVETTLKIDLTDIEATDSEPYVLEATIIVPEQLEFCHYLFDVERYEFGPDSISRSQPNGFQMPTLTEDFHFPDYPSVNVSAFQGPTPYGTPPQSVLTSQEGEWDIDIPSFLASNVQSADADIDALEPGWDGVSQGDGGKGISLYRINGRATYIPQLVALFSAGLTGAKSVQFTNISLGNPTSYDWNFGDASAHNTSASPSHTYVAPGNYTVTLTVTNAYGDTDSYSATIVVPLIAVVSWTPQTYPRAQFSSAGSINAVTYDWNFGDGSAHSSAANPNHLFPSGPGTYVVTLTIGDGAGNFATAQTTVTIGAALVAAFIWAPLSPVDHTVQFTDTSSGQIVSWLWQRIQVPSLITFSTAQHPVYAFTGTRSIQLTVTDEYGFTASVTRSVTFP
jgi:PKD repeat protein